MSNPVFIQLVQIPHGAVTYVAVAIQWLFQNDESQLNDLHQDAGGTSMVAALANDRLKSRRQVSRIAYFQLSCADRAQKQVWKDAGQTQHPNLEVTRGELDRTTLFESSCGHPDQSEHSVLRFLFRQKPVHQLDHSAGADGTVIIFEDLHGRIQ